MPARRSIRDQAVRRRGRRRLVLGVTVVSVAVAAIAFVTTTTAARILLATGTATVTGTACPSGGPASGSACPTAAPAANPGTRPTRPTAAPAAATGSPTPHPRATTTRTPASAPAASTPPAAGAGSAVTQVLALINEARTQAGLPDYTITAGLRTSSERHNAVMAAGCGLSHQCPGEPSLGARETAAGVPWTTAGENIGEGGPVAGSPAAIAHMAVELTQDMLNEKPPDDGHRRNILSSAFRHLGIAIYRDSSGTVWMTQDFSS
jgi:uncharacterized protein YkwD